MNRQNTSILTRLFLLFIVLAVAAWLVYRLTWGSEDSAWPTAGWISSSPAEHGMDPALLEQMMATVEQNEIAIDSVVVVRHGQIVWEEYRAGYDAKTPHHLQSATKSVTSILIGIAMQQNLIDSVDQKVIDFFPDHTIANLDDRKQAMTLEHLLTMSDGMDWHEHDYPYTDSRNSLRQMWNSDDAVQFVLDTPMAREPGTIRAYNSGTSILLGGILEQVTGRDVLSFARTELFEPLGIEDVRWDKARGDHYHTDGGLYLTPRDMARIGYLMLQEGNWDDRQIVSADWVRRSSTSYYPAPGFQGYGYQWWILPVVEGYAATGHYEQRIYVLPDTEMVVVMTANVADDAPHPAEPLLYRYILPACTDLPAGAFSRQHYDRFDLRYDYPVEYSVLELPLPGQEAPSESAGMVQFTLTFYPFELINISWLATEPGIDLDQALETHWASLSEQAGVSYHLGSRSEGVHQGHTLVRYTFDASAGDVSFAGITGAWYCPTSGRILFFSFSTSPPASETTLEAAFWDRLSSLACH